MVDTLDTDYRTYLEENEPEALADLEGGSMPDKSDYQDQADRMYDILYEGDPIIRSPREVEALDDLEVDIVVHIGCHGVRTPHTVDGIMATMDALGYNAIPLGKQNNCCGIFEATEGDFEAAERINKHRFENVEAFNPDYMLAECTSCHTTTETLALGYFEPDFEIVTMSEFLYQHRDDLSRLATETDPVSVTPHDGFGIYGRYNWEENAPFDEARGVLSALPGVEIVEMQHNRENFLPCGLDEISYGDVSNFEYDNTSEGVWIEAEESGADILMTFRHGCDMELEWYDPHFSVETQNYMNFIAERLGYNIENRGKRYKKWGQNEEFERILEHSRPIFESNGMQEDVAQQTIKEVFGKFAY